jgi:hypothetical protein
VDSLSFSDNRQKSNAFAAKRNPRLRTNKTGLSSEALTATSVPPWNRFTTFESADSRIEYAHQYPSTTGNGTRGRASPREQSLPGWNASAFVSATCKSTRYMCCFVMRNLEYRAFGHLDVHILVLGLCSCRQQCCAFMHARVHFKHCQERIRSRHERVLFNVVCCSGDRNRSTTLPPGHLSNTLRQTPLHVRVRTNSEQPPPEASPDRSKR